MFGRDIDTLGIHVFGACYIVGLVYTTIYWFALREIYIYKIKRHIGEKNIYRRQVIMSITLIGVYLIMQTILDFLFTPLIKKYAIDVNLSWQFKFLIGFIFAILISVIYESILLTSQLIKSNKEKEELQKANIASELSGLKEQINPHFLFNSLNTLSTLVHEDANRADNFISKLANVYRYILDKNQEQLVTLEEELKYLEAYIHLMKERFGSSLNFSINVEPHLLNRKVMPLSLQITFENCVKHNIVTKDKPLMVKIYDHHDGQYLCIENNAQPIKFKEVSSGVGLNNIRSRYAYFTNAEVIIEDNSDYYKVCLPLLNEKK